MFRFLAATVLFSQAVENGLVDELGGLHDAIAHAAQAAGLPSDGYRTALIPPRKPHPLQWLMGDASPSVLMQHVEQQQGWGAAERLLGAEASGALTALQTVLEGPPRPHALLPSALGLSGPSAAGSWC